MYDRSGGSAMSPHSAPSPKSSLKGRDLSHNYTRNACCCHEKFGILLGSFGQKHKKAEKNKTIKKVTKKSLQ